jgi:hypothetical protein
VLTTSDVLREWAAGNDRYAKYDLGYTPPALILREADGSPVTIKRGNGREGLFVVENVALDGLLDQAYVSRADDGTYRLTDAGLKAGRGT